MRWTDVAHFLTLARTGSLRSAGRELGVAATTIARRVEALEQSLGTPLFLRDSRGYVLTEAGRALAEAGRDIEERFVAIGRRFERRDEVAGDVRVSSTEIVTSQLLAPAMPALFARHPRLTVTLAVEPSVVSFARGTVDLAVRMVRPSGAHLVVRRLASVELGLFATRSYRAARDAHGAADRFLAYDASYGRIPEVVWFERAGLAPRVALKTSSTRAILEATLQGGGVGLLPAFLAARHPELVTVPRPAGSPPLPTRGVFLVTHEALRKRPAVAAVWEHLVRTIDVRRA
jgi:DNA-binding transcriptional LysR family regulator